MTDPMLRVVVAEPGKPAEVRDIEHTLETMQGIVHGNVECVTMHGGFVVWMNDEARLHFFDTREPQVFTPNRLVKANGEGWWDLVGPLFVAKSDDEGNTVGLSLEEAETVCAWFNYEGDVCRPLRPEEVGEPQFGVFAMR